MCEQQRHEPDTRLRDTDKLNLDISQSSCDGSTALHNVINTNCDNDNESLRSNELCGSEKDSVHFTGTDENGKSRLKPNTVNSKMKGLHLMHLNVHHLAPKIANGEIKTELDSLGLTCHVLGFSETFLTEEIYDAEVELPGYVLHRKDRQGKLGGGIAD